MQAAGPTIAAASRPPSRKPKTKELPSDYEVFLRPPPTFSPYLSILKCIASICTQQRSVEY